MVKAELVQAGTDFVYACQLREGLPVRHNLLLIDDDPGIRDSMSAFLADEGFLVRAVSSGEEGIALIRQKAIPFSIALIDFHMPDMNGPEVIRRIREHDRDLVVLGFSGDDSVEAHNDSLDSGAAFFVNKDTADAKLLGILHRSCKEVERRTKPLCLVNPSENRKLIESVGMIGISNSLAEVARLILKFASSKESVLIRGENGTGKEKVARALHQHSRRKLKPFIAVNCASIPESLIESELFGHEKGAFTGAHRDRVGYFQAAHEGTIFLDEIGELPLHLQATLLRVLQEKTITPVGSNKSKMIDFRLIAATNAPLEELIRQKKFREDLFFRLNVLPITLRPLRDRTDDIPVLAEAFLTQANADAGTNRILLESMAEELKQLPWRGNVRELEHCIRFLVNVSQGPVLDEAYLKEKMPDSFTAPPPIDLVSLKFSREREEKKFIVEALEQGGSVSAAAKRLGISRSTLRDKIKKHGIEVQRFTHGETTV